jgi:hypothetical protein
MTVTARLVPELPDGGLTFWVIYDSPDDYPGVFVVRRQCAIRDEVLAEGRIIGTAKSLDEARALVPSTLFRMPRLLGDSPSIVEAWF